MTWKLSEWNACGYWVKWRIMKGFYKPIALRCRVLLKNFPNIRGEWIRREENNLADELSKAELKKAGIKFKIQPEKERKTHDETE